MCEFRITYTKNSKPVEESFKGAWSDLLAYVKTLHSDGARKVFVETLKN